MESEEKKFPKVGKKLTAVELEKLEGLNNTDRDAVDENYAKKEEINDNDGDKDEGEHKPRF